MGTTLLGTPRSSCWTVKAATSGAWKILTSSADAGLPWVFDFEVMLRETVGLETVGLGGTRVLADAIPLLALADNVSSDFCVSLLALLGIGNWIRFITSFQ